MLADKKHRSRSKNIDPFQFPSTNIAFLLQKIQKQQTGFDQSKQHALLPFLSHGKG